MLSHRPISIHEDAPLYARTPGRALKGRDLLQENTIQRTRPMTGKVVKQPYQTPLRDDKPGKIFTIGKGTASRPLGDKTPFPNRAAFAATPGPAGAKLAALLSQTPGHLLRPSSMRQSTRRRSSGRPNVFETPMNAGDHWNVSDTEVEVDAVEEEPELAPTDDFDEIEYMPPTAIDVPYQPAFDMPDYALTGAQLYNTMHSFPYDDWADLYYAAERDHIGDEGLLQASGYTDNWDILQLPELEDDSPFTTAPKIIPTTAPLPSIPGRGATSRPLNANRTQASAFGARVASSGSSMRTGLATTTASGRPAGAASTISKRAMPSSTTNAASSTRAASRTASTVKPSPSSSRAPSTLPATRPTTAASIRPPRAPLAPSTARPATSMGSRTAKAAAIPRSATSMATRPISQSKTQPGAGRSAATAASKPSSLPVTLSAGARKATHGQADAKSTQTTSNDSLIISFDSPATDPDDFVFEI
ncbi:unnamed protein product [Peniophora sp. CBMAI 1063]|nr:unnamed protein product [Peniophora sp. CBMAI 1063]